MGEHIASIVGLRKNGDEFPADATISRLEAGGKTILTVALRDISEQKRVEAEYAFLARAGEIVGSTLDYEQTLTNIAELVVRDLADFCIVDLIGEGGEVRKFKVASRDEADAWISDTLEHVRLDPSRPYFSEAAVKTMRPVLHEHVSPEAIAALAQNDQHLAALQGMRARSVIVVPLLGHEEPLGAISFVSSSSVRTYARTDVAVASELGRRAACSIENARLYAAARNAIRSRDDVLGIVAHDLRNPLNAIALQVELLRSRNGDGRSPPIDAIERAAKRMKRLIQDLVDITGLEAGQLRFEPTDVSTEALLAECTSAQRPLAMAASIELRLDAPRDLPHVWVDHDRLLQILENLIGNALKFTPRGGRVTVGACPHGDDVEFWVSDTGRGIAPEDQPHVFDRFWQARRDPHAGAGLGLPIVKGLVEVHGGRIWVESSQGHGSTFFFTLRSTSCSYQSKMNA
jgi:signal transduction histidine kinase